MAGIGKEGLNTLAKSVKELRDSMKDYNVLWQAKSSAQDFNQTNLTIHILRFYARVSFSCARNKSCC